MWTAKSLALHVQAVVQRQEQLLRIRVTQDRANAAAVAAGVTIPAGYASCVSQTQHNSWQYECNSQNAANATWASATVKGLGGSTTPTGPFCALALLPVCASLSPLAPLRPKPVPPTPPPPVAPVTPAPAPVPVAPRPAPQPVVVTRAPAPATKPTPPVLNTAPQQIPPSAALSPAPPATVAPSTKSAGLVRNGLLLLVIAGGSYALYRTFKKPKAA